ncbi:MAG TPA: BTAD domain-containing putative transcriptional regulator [Actinocrinis sp.]|nr:BTAD domain-containing putative transcriptional regulator [Actinocrinis sp.]
MRFRVLGPVAVMPRTPSATKVRVVLAVLLVRANETVSTEGLIDELWDDSPPRTAGTTLQVYISQLRRILAEGESPPDGAEPPRTPAQAGQRLITVPPGYRLQVAEDEVDLMRFEALHQRGRTAYESGDYTGASTLLREALDLWSGAALSGIPHGYTLSTAAVRLDEQRMAALEQRITADLRLGRHKELTGELMALINENPLRETLYAHLMVALFRSDRQSDALRTFAKARRALVDELGIEPGPGLRLLHERILRSDPQLIWRDQAAAGTSGSGGAVVWLPAALPDFVGREEPMAAALRALPDGTAGRPSARVLVVGGRAGVGKTAFAVELARRTARQFPHGRVFVSLRDEEGAAIGAGQAMARLAQRLDPSAGAKARPPAGEDTAERLRRLARGRRMLLILDDVATEDQVRPLLAAAPEAFAVITTRRALAGLDGARHLVLDVLQPKEAQQLLTEIVGGRIAQDPDAAQDIARLTGYLPLGLRAAGAGLAARPHWSAAALAQRLEDDETSLGELAAGDLDVRSSLAAAYQEADDRQKRAFRLLALSRVPSFSLWSAAALLESSLPEAERLIDELIQAHLLEVRPSARDKPLRYGYHRLLRALALDLLNEDDDESVTAAIQRLSAISLGFVRHADSQLTPGRVPYEERYGPVGGRLTARATEVIGANPVLWFQEECPNLVDTVRRAHAAGLWSLVWKVAESLAGYFEARAAWAEWAETHELALDAARRAGDRAAEAEVLRSLGDLAWQQQRMEEAGRHFEDARALFTLSGQDAAAARCLIGSADVAISAGESARAEKMYTDALSRCAAAQDDRGRADAMRGLAVVELQCGRAESALHAFTEFADLAERLGDRRWLQFAHRTKTWILELASAWSDGQEGWVPRAVEARPGIWVVGGYPD